jgi:hypothetical protein
MLGRRTEGRRSFSSVAAAAGAAGASAAGVWRWSSWRVLNDYGAVDVLRRHHVHDRNLQGLVRARRPRHGHPAVGACSWPAVLVVLGARALAARRRPLPRERRRLGRPTRYPAPRRRPRRAPILCLRDSRCCSGFVLPVAQLGLPGPGATACLRRCAPDLLAAWRRNSFGLASWRGGPALRRASPSCIDLRWPRSGPVSPLTTVGRASWRCLGYSIPGRGHRRGRASSPCWRSPTDLLTGGACADPDHRRDAGALVFALRRALHGGGLSCRSRPASPAIGPSLPDRRHA